MPLGTHVHHRGCWKAVLICRRRQHPKHDKILCYHRVKGRRAKLICVLPLHKHGRDCYEVQRVCGQPV